MIKRLRELYARWVRIGKRVAAFQIRLLFSVAYVLFIIPSGFLFRLFSGYPPRGWRDAPDTDTTVDQARRQF